MLKVSNIISNVCIMHICLKIKLLLLEKKINYIRKYDQSTWKMYIKGFVDLRG